MFAITPKVRTYSGIEETYGAAAAFIEEQNYSPDRILVSDFPSEYLPGIPPAEYRESWDRYWDAFRKAISFRKGLEVRSVKTIVNERHLEEILQTLSNSEEKNAQNYEVKVFPGSSFPGVDLLATDEKRVLLGFRTSPGIDEADSAIEIVDERAARICLTYFENLRNNPRWNPVMLRRAFEPNGYDPEALVEIERRLGLARLIAEWTEPPVKITDGRLLYKEAARLVANTKDTDDIFSTSMTRPADVTKLLNYQDFINYTQAIADRVYRAQENQGSMTYYFLVGSEGDQVPDELRSLVAHRKHAFREKGVELNKFDCRYINITFPMDFLFAGDSMLIAFSLRPDDPLARLGISITDANFSRLVGKWFERCVWNPMGMDWDEFSDAVDGITNYGPSVDVVDVEE